MKLPFDDLLRELDTDENPSGIGEFLEAEHRLDAGFHASMILLHDIVQVRTTTDLDRCGRNYSIRALPSAKSVI
jgi:hypothetical protein